MKTIELSTGTLYVLSIEEIFNGVNIPHVVEELGHPSEITGEVWGKVVEAIVEQPEFVGDKSRTFHKDYLTKVYKHWDALLSGLSLIAAHNIQESDVLLFKAKNS